MLCRGQEDHKDNLENLEREDLRVQLVPLEHRYIIALMLCAYISY